MANFFKNLLFGSEPKIEQMQNYTPQQQQLLDQQLQNLTKANPQMFQFLMSLLSGEPGAFEDFERPALEQFNQQIIPGILERFTGGDLGGMNKGSSGLNQSLAQAARGLSGDLASQRSNLKFNALNYLNQQAQGALSPRTTPYQVGGTRGVLDIFSQAAPMLAGKYFGL